MLGVKLVWLSEISQVSHTRVAAKPTQVMSSVKSPLDHREELISASYATSLVFLYVPTDVTVSFFFPCPPLLSLKAISISLTP